MNAGTVTVSLSDSEFIACTYTLSPNTGFHLLVEPSSVNIDIDFSVTPSGASTDTFTLNPTATDTAAYPDVSTGIQTISWSAVTGAKVVVNCYSNFATETTVPMSNTFTLDLAADEIAICIFTITDLDTGIASLTVQLEVLGIDTDQTFTFIFDESSPVIGEIDPENSFELADPATPPGVLPNFRTFSSLTLGTYVLRIEPGLTSVTSSLGCVSIDPNIIGATNTNSTLTATVELTSNVPVTCKFRAQF